MRVDKFLSLSDLFKSRSQAKQALDAERVLINGKLAKTSSTVNPGDEIEILAEKEEPQQLTPINFKKVYEDDDIVIIEKPAGVLVHRTQEGKENSLVDELKKNTTLSRGYSPDRPGIVHRLDRDTSGLLVVAKTDAAQDSLYEQFQQKSISRIYLAIINHRMEPSEGTISSYLIRHPRFRTKRVSLRDQRTKKIIRPESVYPVKDYVEENQGRLAITHYKTLFKNSNGDSLLEVSLETGRTHQIRVHLNDSGAPIVGDRMYSGSEQLKRCALHAYKLELIHPRTKKIVSFKSTLPDDMKNLMKELGLKFEV